MSIEQQVQVLNSLTQIMHDSASGQYEEIRCEFEYEVYDGGWSVGSKYSFVRDGLFFSELLDDPEDRVSSHVHNCLLYTSPSPRDLSTSRMPSSA